MPEGNPQAYEASPYQQAWDQFGSMMPPDPNTFLQLIWPFLDINTRHLVQRLLTNPAAGQSSQGAPIVTTNDPAAAGPVDPSRPTVVGFDGQRQPLVAEGGKVQPMPAAEAAPTSRNVQFGGRTVSIDSLQPKGSAANPVGQTGGTQRIFMKDGDQRVADLATGTGIPTPTKIDPSNAQFEVDMGGGTMAYAKDAEGLKRLRAAAGRS